MKSDTCTAYNDSYWYDEDDKRWRYTINAQYVKSAVLLMSKNTSKKHIMAPELLPDRLLDLRGVARFIKVDYDTARTYRSKGILPNPVMIIGTSPYWTKPIIVAWDNGRPGQGGGVRPTRATPLYNQWKRYGKLL